MKVLFRGSIRANLALIVLLAVLPLFMMILISGYVQRENGLNESRAEALRLVDVFSAQQEQITHGVNKLLFALSRLPAVQQLEGTACSPLFRQIVSDNPVHANITLLTPQGEVLASALPFSKSSFADQAHVMEAIRTKKFSVGEYLVGRISNVPIIPFAMPVTDLQDNLVGILTTSINLEIYHRLFEKTSMPGDSILSLLDRNGRRLLYYPPKKTNPLGEKILSYSWSRFSGTDESGVIQHTGADGIRRLYAFHQLRFGSEGTPPSMYVVVAIPEAQALAKADAVTRKNLLWLLVATALSISLSLFVGRVGIVRPLSVLTGSAKRLGEGELGVTSGLSGLSGAIGQLARAFDNMSMALKTSAQEREQAENELFQVQSILTAAMNQSTAGIAIADAPDGKLRYVNDAGLMIRGGDRKDVVNGVGVEQYVSSWQLLDFDGRSLSTEEVPLARAIIFGERNSREFIIRRKENDDRIVLANAAPVMNEKGMITAGVVVFLDITERKKAEEKLMETNRSLEEAIARAEELAEQAQLANKAKSEFLANMSHEIRTPLNGIIGMLQLMSTTSLSDNQNEYLLAALKSASRLTRLLSDILDLSSIESGRMSIRESEFVVRSLNNSLMELFSLAAKEKSINLEIFIDERMPSILIVDDNRLMQILFNLVGNAVKFTDKGKVCLSVSPLPYGNDRHIRVLFIVSDSGIGIPDTRIKDIFEPFMQVEGSYRRRFQGAGLGLSIVRKLVRLMNGDLSIDSNEGEGTTVFLSIPCKLPAPSPQKSDKELPVKACGAIPYRILFVEDDEVNLLAGKRMLEKLGYEVITADNGINALEKLEMKDFDLIIMDIQMPVMDGVEATARIRAGRKADIPIIAMTAYTMSGDREKFLMAGMNDYIAKPVSMDGLKEVIEKTMKNC